MESWEVRSQLKDFFINFYKVIFLNKMKAIRTEWESLVKNLLKYRWTQSRNKIVVIWKSNQSDFERWLQFLSLSLKEF